MVMDEWTEQELQDLEMQIYYELGASYDEQ